MTNMSDAPAPKSVLSLQYDRSGRHIYIDAHAIQAVCKSLNPAGGHTAIWLQGHPEPLTCWEPFDVVLRMWAEHSDGSRAPAMRYETKEG